MFAGASRTIEVLDTLRLAYAVAAVPLLGMLLVRAYRYRGRTRETAFLHIMGCFLLAAASLTALGNLGRGYTMVMPLNIIGIVLGWFFVIKSPMEKVVTWKERRGDDPDWSRFSSGSNW